MTTLRQIRPRQKERGRWIVAGLVAGAALVVVIATTRGGQPQGPKFETASLLAQARAEAPFQLRYPATIPPGFTPNNVIWGGADPIEYPGSTDFFVDFWLVDAKGMRLHVWQTNLEDLGAEDPIRSPDGISETIAGAEWIYQRISLGGYPLFQLSRRFPDGILVTIDYPVDGPVLRDIARALAAAGEQGP